MNKERLQLMVTMLREIEADQFKREHFNLIGWVDIWDTQAEDYLSITQGSLLSDGLTNVAECGTAACACGWAAQDARFRTQGFKLHFEPNSHRSTVRSVLPAFKDYVGWEAVSVFFGVGRAKAEYLFLASSYETYAATPGQVADRIEEFITQ